MGTRRKRIVALDPEEIQALRTRLRRGIQPVRVVQRARTLLLLEEGQSPPKVAHAVGLSAPAVRNIGSRDCGRGVHAALYDRPRPGAEPALDTAQRQPILAMVCSDPPPGFARWSVRWITEEAVKRKLVSRVGRETIRWLLLDHDLKPWREKSWCIAELDDEYILKMEDVLAVYERPYSAAEPVVCLDEKPVTLHAEVRSPQPAAPGKVARRDNEYKRCGTANVFCAVEPKAGQHVTFPTPTRSADEFAREIVERALHYPVADTIHLLMDNLNTHSEYALSAISSEPLRGGSRR